MPGPLLQIQRLIYGSVQIQHEVYAQIAVILQGGKTAPARARHIKMNHKLVHHLLQQRQVPAATAHALQFRRRQLSLAHPIPVG